MGDEGKIFVGGLHWNTTNEGLKAYFEQFGQVVDCNIMRDPTGRSRCFGFVTFADPLAVDIVLQKTHILDKKQIDPKRAIPRDQPHPLPQSSQGGAGGIGRDRLGSVTPSREENKVFVGGIHVEADEEDLKEAMSQFGEVAETILMRDRETSRSRGFGFVTFASHDAALKACEEQDLRIKARKVEVKMAVPKGKQPLPQRPIMGGAPGAAAYGPSSSTSADPYAAWAEYFKQYPEYYEAMMKAYSNPSAMAAYYSQYYAAAGGAAPHPQAAAQAQSPDLSTYNNPPMHGYYAQSPPSAPPQGAEAIGDAYYYGGASGAAVSEELNGRGWQKSDRRSQPYHYRGRSRSRSRSRSRDEPRSPATDSVRRGSRSPSRSRSRSPGHSRGRSRSPRDTRGGTRDDYRRDHYQSSRYERAHGGSRNELNTDNNYAQGTHRSPPLPPPSYAPHIGDGDHDSRSPGVSYRPEDEYQHDDRHREDQSERSHESSSRHDRRRRD